MLETPFSSVIARHRNGNPNADPAKDPHSSLASKPGAGLVLTR
ncbi:hypothetical protein NSU_2086 [Novosphingobium pentaromativorans US6-1]|uniref:Uncharacterized protein n=1 Tax=Novosphingobium pentaromativorans US6-1 TaxID=1088721 RepID=G6ECL5_9SPHN|nr:hypothetical protein NSU_2086 [Novosphingobium pentaromativorans US6-1]